MYEILIAKITETLEGIENVKDIFSTPKTKLTKFPCVFFKPAGLTNDFETNNENLNIYNFMMIVLVGTNTALSPEEAFSTILPHTVDAIMSEFNGNWNGGTVDGHRISVKIGSAEPWELSEEQDGLVAYAPLNIEIKLLSNN